MATRKRTFSQYEEHYFVDGSKRIRTGFPKIWEHGQILHRDEIVRSLYQYAQSTPLVYVLKEDIVVLKAVPPDADPLFVLLIKLGTTSKEHHFCNNNRLHLLLNCELPADIDLLNPGLRFHLFVTGYGVNLGPIQHSDIYDDKILHLLYIGSVKYRYHTCAEPSTTIYRLYLQLYDPSALPLSTISVLNTHVRVCPLNKYGTPFCDGMPMNAVQ